MSARYAWPTAVVLFLILVPTIANVYLPEAPFEGTLADTIPERLPNHGPAKPGKHADDPEWALRNYSAEDYLSRRYAGIEFFAARTYDAKALFHNPELALTYGIAATNRHKAEIETPVGPATVQVVEFEVGRTMHFSAYVLFYGTRAMDEPFSFMLGVLPELFVGGRQPATLIYVQADARANETPDDLEKRLLRLLEAACGKFLRDA